jgi:hypothetical protein
LDNNLAQKIIPMAVSLIKKINNKIKIKEIKFFFFLLKKIILKKIYGK